MKKKTLRIIIFNWRDPWDPMSGGAERVTLKHALYWVSCGHSVTWVSGTYQNAKPEEIKESIRYLRIGNSKTLFLRAWWIFWFTLKGEADVIIDEVHGLPMFSPLWAKKTKVIGFIHEVAQEIWSEMFSFPVSTLGKSIEKYLFPIIYRDVPFWVDCDSTKQDLIKLGLHSKKVTVIPCAIDPIPQIAPQSKEKKLTCIFVARLVKMKGIEYALKAFSEVLDSEPTAKLWVVGDGVPEYLATLHLLCKELGITTSVKFWGLVSEKQKFTLLARAHFLLHTSIREGFGLTVLEANSQSTPAAVFDVAALRDLVSEKNGIIVPFGKTQTMARKIIQLWSSQSNYRKIQKAAYTFSQQFRWRTFTRQSEGLLHL